jgi:hypothetical protein
MITNTLCALNGAMIAYNAAIIWPYRGVLLGLWKDGLQWLSQLN